MQFPALITSLLFLELAYKQPLWRNIGRTGVQDIARAISGNLPPSNGPPTEIKAKLQEKTENRTLLYANRVKITGAT